VKRRCVTYVRARRNGVAGRTKRTRNTRFAVRAISRCNARRRETHAARSLSLSLSLSLFLSFSLPRPFWFFLPLLSVSLFFYLPPSPPPSVTRTRSLSLSLFSPFPCASLTLSFAGSRAARPSKIGEERRKGSVGTVRNRQRWRERKKEDGTYAHVSPYPYTCARTYVYDYLSHCIHVSNCIHIYVYEIVRNRTREEEESRPRGTASARKQSAAPAENVVVVVVVVVVGGGGGVVVSSLRASRREHTRDYEQTRNRRGEASARAARAT